MYLRTTFEEGICGPVYDEEEGRWRRRRRRNKRKAWGDLAERRSHSVKVDIGGTRGEDGGQTTAWEGDEPETRGGKTLGRPRMRWENGVWRVRSDGWRGEEGNRIRWKTLVEEDLRDSTGEPRE